MLVVPLDWGVCWGGMDEGWDMVVGGFFGGRVVGLSNLKANWRKNCRVGKLFRNISL